MNKSIENKSKYDDIRFGANLISIRKTLWGMDIPENQLPDIYKMFEAVESRTRTEVVEAAVGIVEGMKATETPNVPQGHPKMLGYNRACSDISSAIKKLGNKG